MQCPIEESTVFVEGLDDTVPEIKYFERFNSLGGVLGPGSTMISAISIGQVYSEERKEWKYRGSGFFLFASENLARYAVDQLHRRTPAAWTNPLNVKLSNNPMSVKVSKDGPQRGQPRTGEDIFNTTHAGYSD